MLMRMHSPEVSNRFVFVRSKTILVQKLGSQTAALQVMKKDPAILQVCKCAQRACA